MTMGDHELEALVDGFGAAAALAAAAGVDGVEIDIGVQSLLRQFHSGLTNLRHDAYGTDRLALTRRVLAAVRGAVGDDRVVAVRLSCDELAPWAGVTPEEAAGHVAGLAPLVDLITVVRGGPFSVDAYRPGSHEPPGFNRDLCRSMRDAAGGRAAVALQGSVVEAAMADEAVAEGTADLVEMTRALIADPALVAKVRAGEGSRVRPCILCNQACRVRDPRNPLVSCVGNPHAGHETAEPDTDDDTDAGGDGNGGTGGTGTGTGRRVLVVGAGPAGLECARVLAGRGHHVRVAEHGQVAGGALRASAVGPGRGRLSLLADWLERECRRAGVAFAFGSPVGPGELDRAADDDEVVVLATGSRPRPVGYPVRGAVVVDIVEALAGSPDEMAPGGVLVDDPVGGPVGVAAALWLAGAGRDVALVSPDPVAATLLSLAGDLAGANTRLQRAGVTRELRSRIREVADGRAELVDVWTGAARSVPCAVLVSCGAPPSRGVPLPDPPGHPPDRGLRGPPQRARVRAGGPAHGHGHRCRRPRQRRPAASGGGMTTGPAGGLSGRVAVVTGAGRGMGRTHAVRLAEEGADVIALDRCRDIDHIPYAMATAADLDETGWLVEAAGSRAFTAEVDVRDPTGLADAVAAGVARLGPLDIVVANAGVCTVQPWDEVTPEVWRTVLDVNLTGVWNTCTATIPHVRDGGGSLILISSSAGLKGQPFFAPYVAAKHGVVGIMRSLANELASSGIRVNSVHPTGVVTPMTEQLTGLGRAIAARPELGPLFENALPVAVVEPDDVADAVVFLASDRARYVTGLTMTVDAGAGVR